MRTLKVGLGLLIAAVMLVGMVGVGWGVPNLINVQGRLVDKATGLAVADQTLDVTVNYYTTITGGTPIAAISGTAYAPRTDSNGVFNLTLGEGLPEALKPDFTSEDYYVEFVVGATIGGTWRMETIPDPTLPSPANKRQRLVSVPFSITAKNVRGGTVVADGRNWVSVYGTNTFTTDNNIKSAYVESPAGSGTFLPVGAIAGKADGGYTGVSGLSNKGFGVFGSTLRTEDQNAAGVGGLSASSGSGVWGANIAAATTTGNRDGVYGTSVNGSGMRGVSLGTATSADPSLGAGVIGKNTQATIPTGRIAAPGVYGESVNGQGVRGLSTNGAGVVGTSTGGNGVYGSSTRGIGIFGDKSDDADNDPNPAIYGLNSETNSGENPGIKGVSEKGYGVMGRSNGWHGVFGETGGTNANAGVYGYSSSGTGVHGVSNSSSRAGVTAANTGTGPALELGSGRIKIQPVNATITSWASGITEVTANGALGKILLPAFPSYLITTPPGWMTVRVRNSYVTNNSMILLGGYNSGAYLVYESTRTQMPGVFTVRIFPVPGLDDGTLTFMVIN